MEARAGRCRPRLSRPFGPRCRPTNGDIFLRRVDEDTGVVTVELVGACVSCPASTVTLKAGVERILKDRVEVESPRW